MTKLSVNEERILNACKKASKKNPITRAQLQHITKLADTDNRDIIGRLRDKGYRIINTNNGYWLTKSEKDYKEWAEKYKRYAMTVLRRLSAMDKRTEGQIGW